MRKIFAMILCLSLTIGVIAGCSQGDGSKGDYAGTYEGTAEGYHGDIRVEVTLDDDGKITEIKVDENHNETKGIAEVPIEKIPKAILDTQSLSVDAVSGATLTGDGIVGAVADALTKAGLDPAKYDFTEKRSDKITYEFDKDALPEKEPKTGSVTVTDARGREVEIGLPVSTYAMSTMDVIDYIVPLIGEDAFSKLVGSGQDGGNGLQGYAELYTPIVGEYMNHVGQISDHNAPFDLEMILAVEPDVIIVNSAMGAHRYVMEVESQLAEAGIPIVLIDIPGKDQTTSVQDTLKLLGQIFEQEDKAKEVATFIDDQYALLESKNLTERTDKPTVYYEKSGYSEIYGVTSPSASGWGTSIAIAGGDNIADPLLADTAASKGGGSTIDPEYIIESDPDFIILTGSGLGWMDNHKGSEPGVAKFDIVNRTGWKDLKAVKNNNVYEFSHTTNRSLYGFQAALRMAQIFYPEEFKDVDVDAIMKEFFDKYTLLDSDVTIWDVRINEGSK
ncbi:MAG: ABC transporter substrate-binding protein [Eubacteriaceae bacterium]|nr:ABC transporter substrate-binding protein [Eubacteriaceae bacterium]